jgi:hypothetical protein
MRILTKMYHYTGVVRVSIVELNEIELNEQIGECGAGILSRCTLPRGLNHILLVIAVISAATIFREPRRGVHGSGWPLQRGGAP